MDEEDLPTGYQLKAMAMAIAMATMIEFERRTEFIDRASSAAANLSAFSSADALLEFPCAITDEIRHSISRSGLWLT